MSEDNDIQPAKRRGRPRKNPPTTPAVLPDRNLPTAPPLDGPPTTQLQKLEQDDDKRVFIGKSLQNILAISRAFDEPVRTDEALIARLGWFFESCANTNQLPTVEKMCLAIGWPRETVFEIIQGIQRGFSPETADILKKAKNLIASLDAELAQEGKIQPVVYLFRAKNYYGMRDQQEMVLTPNNRLNDYQDAATIERKYAELPEA